jgi:hypothetical protein
MVTALGFLAGCGTPSRDEIGSPQPGPQMMEPTYRNQSPNYT